LGRSFVVGWWVQAWKVRRRWYRLLWSASAQPSERLRDHQFLWGSVSVMSTDALRLSKRLVGLHGGGVDIWRVVICWRYCRSRLDGCYRVAMQSSSGSKDSFCGLVDRRPLVRVE
jgi:hypothetical protein